MWWVYVLGLAVVAAGANWVAGLVFPRVPGEEAATRSLRAVIAWAIIIVAGLAFVVAAGLFH